MVVRDYHTIIPMLPWYKSLYHRKMNAGSTSCPEEIVYHIRRKFKRGVSLLYHGCYHSNHGINIYIYKCPLWSSLCSLKAYTYKYACHGERVKI